MNTIAVIGLGYVGLPLVVEFGKHARTIGFDISVPKVESCQRGVDPSREMTDEEITLAVHAEYTADLAKLRQGACAKAHAVARHSCQGEPASTCSV